VQLILVRRVFLATKIVPMGREKTAFLEEKHYFFVFFKKGGFGGVAVVFVTVVTGKEQDVQ